MCAQMAPTFFAEEPDWAELREHASESCYCRGEGALVSDETTAPSINMANSNCRDVTEALGLGRDNSGSLDPELAAIVLRRALKILNVSGKVESMIRDDIQEGRVLSCGTTTESVRKRLKGIIEVLKYAVEHSQDAEWS